MRLIDSIRRSGRSLRQSKIRTLLTASAIGVGTFALTLTLAASNGAQSFVDDIISQNFNPAELIVANDPSVLTGTQSSKPREYNENFTSSNSNGVTTQAKQLSDADISRLKQTAGVAEVRQAISPVLRYVSGPNAKKYIATAYTVSPAQYGGLGIKAGSVSGTLRDKKLILPESYVKTLGYTNAAAAIGKPLTVVVQKAFDISSVQAALTANPANLQQAAQAGTQSYSFTIAAVYKAPVAAQPGTDSIFYMGLSDAAELNDFATANTPSYHKYTYAYVRVQDGTNPAKLAAVQTRLKADGYQAQSVKDTQKFLTQIISVLRGIVAAFGVIAVIASVFGIVNTMYISVLQRTREIGLMKALGMRRREIGRLFRYEAAWIGLLGGLLGSLAAVAVGMLLNPWIGRKLQLAAGQHLLIFQPAQIAILVVVLMVVAILAGLLPARKAAKLDPIEALRTE